MPLSVPTTRYIDEYNTGFPSTRTTGEWGADRLFMVPLFPPAPIRVKTISCVFRRDPVGPPTLSITTALYRITNADRVRTITQADVTNMALSPRSVASTFYKSGPILSFDVAGPHRYLWVLDRELELIPGGPIYMLALVTNNVDAQWLGAVDSVLQHRVFRGDSVTTFGTWPTTTAVSSASSEVGLPAITLRSLRGINNTAP
jgi:hypothetical protein